MVKQNPEKPKFLIQNNNKKSKKKKKEIEPTKNTPNLSSRVDLLFEKGEMSVEIPPRVHFPIKNLSKNTPQPNKRLKYNQFYKTQNFKKKKPKNINLFKQIERQHRIVTNPNTKGKKLHSHHPIALT